MRPHFRLALSLLSIATFGIQAHANEMDDSVILEQIDASVHQYRTVLAEFGHLEMSLRQSSDEQDVANFPTMREYIQVSMDPADRSMRELFKRYESEYGEKAFHQVAKRRGFADLIQDTKE